MSVAEAFREHHRQLLEYLEAYREGPTLSPAELQSLRAFLLQDLLPHAQGEERALYPAVEPLIRQHGQATATMRVDHEFIEGYIRQIDGLIQRIQGAEPEGRASAERELRRLLIELYALLRVHMAKEERVYLPLFERYLSLEEQQRVFEAMHPGGAEPGFKTVQELDVRSVPPPQRHPLIFQTFEALRPGEAFILVNDHDPKPLYYQFQYERPGQFSWTYLEQGPEVWRVRIGRVAS
ncbi:MAG TPA: DUF2249 domain-containing protein [Thermoflexus sp.]|nr:DUF2249 domain-containing protein [Thermoflexus sp.]